MGMCIAAAKGWWLPDLSARARFMMCPLFSSERTTFRTRVAIGDGSETEIWYYAGTAAKRLIVGERGFCLIERSGTIRSGKINGHKWIADAPYTATIRYIASDAQPLRMQAQCRSAEQSRLCLKAPLHPCRSKAQMTQNGIDLLFERD